MPMTEPMQLFSWLQAALNSSGFATLKFTEHHFQPCGYTALWLLAESHLAVHTFPEHGTSYVEIASCILDKYQRFIELLEVEPNISQSPEGAPALVGPPG